MKRTPLKRGTARLKRYTPLRWRKKRPERHVTKDGRLILSGAAYQKLTDEVYERDGGMCQACPGPHWIPRARATLDHKRIRGMGGAWRHDVKRNVRLACWKGNTDRGSKPL